MSNFTSIGLVSHHPASRKITAGNEVVAKNTLQRKSNNNRNGMLFIEQTILILHIPFIAFRRFGFSAMSGLMALKSG